LRKESAAIKQLRATLVEPGAAERVFEKVRSDPGLLVVSALIISLCCQVYNHDISRLLLMEDLWKHRTPPHPISFESLSNDSTTAVPQAETSATGAAGIKDQRVLSLKDSFEIFLSRFVLLSIVPMTEN
jgi:ubiquitin-like 1-activating enzyme E1 B